jgi:hypothetical protein
MEKSILYRKVFFFDYEKIDCPMEYKKWHTEKNY